MIADEQSAIANLPQRRYVKNLEDPDNYKIHYSRVPPVATQSPPVQSHRLDRGVSGHIAKNIPWALKRGELVVKV